MTTPVWVAGSILGNTLVGVRLLGDPFAIARAAGLVAAVVALPLLTT